MRFDPDWRTSTAFALAKTIHESRDWSVLPILADALQDAEADEAMLSPLRTEGMSSLSGLWLAGCLGMEGLWELAGLGQEIDSLPPCGHLPGARYCTRCPDDSPHTQLRRRRAELIDSNTHGRGERWDSVPCPACEKNDQDRYQPRHEDNRIVAWECRVCGGSGDLLRRPLTMNETYLTHNQPRPISFDLGPLPVVTVRLEEMVREEGSPPELWNRGRGTGVIHTPSEWLKALPPWYDVTIEGMEPGEIMGSGTWGWIRHDLPAFLQEGEWPEGRSPAAAITSLTTALRRWRYA